MLREGHWYTGTIQVIDGGIMATYLYNLLTSSRPVEVRLPIDYFHYMADWSHGIDIQLTKLGCFHNIQFMLGRSECMSDADPGPRGPCVVAATNKFTQTTESCGGKRMAWPLSQEKSTLILAWTGFYCFSGHIH